MLPILKALVHYRASRASRVPMQAVARLANVIFRPPSVTGRSWKQRSDLYLFRLGCFLCIILVPAFAVFYYAAKPTGQVTWILQGGMTLVALLMLCVTYTSSWARKHARKLLLFLAFLLTSWAAVVASINGFDANFAVGYFVTVVTAAMFLSLAFDVVAPLSWYTSFALATTLVLMSLTPEPEVNEAIFIASILVALAIVYVAVSARIQVQEALTEREGHLAEAQRTASLGNWEVNLQDGRANWSVEMFRIVGLDSETESPSFDEFAARVHPSDRPVLSRFWDTLRARRKHDDITLTLDAVDGTDRSIRLRGAYARATPNRAERLHGICLDVTDEVERARVMLEAKEEAEVAREQAEHAREQAEEMARLKSAFLANMSHEIRTPLTAIIGFAQILGEEVSAEQRELVEPIEQSGKRLLSTLNSVLDLARLKSEGMALNIEPLDVAEEVHELTEMLRPQASAKGLSLIVNAPVCGVIARADRPALNRALTNLLSNAIKFTEVGHITVSVEQTDSMVYIRVHDTGRGIGIEFLPKLFEEFRQESTGVTRSHEGSGLGLAITKGLVELMQGTIEVDSVVGEGSMFTITLPRAVDVGAAVPEPHMSLATFSNPDC